MAMGGDVRRVSVAGVVFALIGAGLTVAPGGLVAAGPPAADDWRTFHHDALHSGVSTNTTISKTAAPSLRLRWQANTGSGNSASPAVAYNAALGKRLVYQPNGVGTMTAYDAATGRRVWYARPGEADVNSSPAVDGNVVYYGSSDSYLYAVNATTGAFICKFLTSGVVSSSPVVANPDGSGKVVYVGDNGFGGSDDGGAMWAINAVDPNAAANCSMRWKYDSFGDPAGSEADSGVWSPPSFARDATGQPRVVFGGSSPDNAVYALDAITGRRVWRFQTEVFAPDNDVGAGPAISAPGVNGFAHGVVYITGKNGIVYALNLTTGAKRWEFRIRDTGKDLGHTRQTAAFLGGRVYVPYGSGVFALDAKTGGVIWNTAKVGPTTEEVSAPAITGPEGARVLVTADTRGDVMAFNLATGARVWTYKAGGPIYSSVAISGGKIFAAGTDSFLYAFGLRSGKSTRPNTSILTPAEGANLDNPDGKLELTGSATDNKGVTRVQVAIQNKGEWWDGSRGTWTKVFTQNRATLGSPGSKSTAWRYSFPVPSVGGTFFAQAQAVDAAGQLDAPVATRNFTVDSLGNPPDTTITVPVDKQVFRFEDASNRRPITIDIKGSASDDSGANPGVDSVRVVVRNLEHHEYYCGSPNCNPNSPEGAPFVTTYTTFEAQVDNPGARSTNWTASFQTYTHPHKYAITAVAVDRDGEVDPFRAAVSPICVRDPGENCAQT